MHAFSETFLSKEFHARHLHDDLKINKMSLTYHSDSNTRLGMNSLKMNLHEKKFEHAREPMNIMTDFVKR